MIFFLLKTGFLNLFFNEKNNMIFMIRNDKTVGKLTKLVSKSIRYSGVHIFFKKKIKKMMKIVKIVAFRGNSGNSGRSGDWDGVLNSAHRGTGRGLTAGDLGE